MTPIEWGILAAGVIAAIALLNAWKKMVFMVVVPTEVTIVIGATAKLQAKLYYKPWFTRKHKPTQGDVKAVSLSSGIVSVAPSKTGVGHQDVATFTLTGGSVGGPATINISGKSRHGSSEIVSVSVTVIAKIG